MNARRASAGRSRAYMDAPRTRDAECVGGSFEFERAQSLPKTDFLYLSRCQVDTQTPWSRQRGRTSPGYVVSSRRWSISEPATVASPGMATTGDISVTRSIIDGFTVRFFPRTRKSSSNVLLKAI